MKIYSRTQGQGAPLVMLHGWGFDSSSMQTLADCLAEHYQVTLLDIPGFGKSKALTPNNLETIVSAISQEIAKDAHVLAWSLGGLIALMLSQRIKLKTLSLIASTPCFIAQADWLGIEANQFKKFKQLVKTNPAEAQKQFNYLQVKNLKQEHKLYPTLLSLSKLENYHADTLEMLETTDLRSLKPNCPMQIILGDQDQLIPKQSLESMKTLWPNAEMHLLAEQGHMPFLNVPEQVAQVIHQFTSKPHAGK